jgi:hypothetical protein
MFLPLRKNACKINNVPIFLTSSEQKGIVKYRISAHWYSKAGQRDDVEIEPEKLHDGRNEAVLYVDSERLARSGFIVPHPAQGQRWGISFFE